MKENSCSPQSHSKTLLCSVWNNLDRYIGGGFQLRRVIILQYHVCKNMLLLSFFMTILYIFPQNFGYISISYTLYHLQKYKKSTIDSRTHYTLSSPYHHQKNIYCHLIIWYILDPLRPLCPLRMS